MSYLEELLPEFRNGAKIRIKSWKDGEYYKFENGKIVNQGNEEVLFFYIMCVTRDDWEIYQEPINWDYIIKNKCLCWFWDDGKESVKDLDFLESKGNRFLDVHGFRWDNCRPVRKDEVTFYDERDD